MKKCDVCGKNDAEWQGGTVFDPKKGRHVTANICLSCADSNGPWRLKPHIVLRGKGPGTLHPHRHQSVFCYGVKEP